MLIKVLHCLSIVCVCLCLERPKTIQNKELCAVALCEGGACSDEL